MGWHVDEEGWNVPARHRMPISEVGEGEYPDWQVGTQVDPEGVEALHDEYTVWATFGNVVQGFAAQ